MFRCAVLCLLLCVVSVGCVADDEPAVRSEALLSDDFGIDVVVTGLDGPTQIALASDGSLLVAEINGGENDAMGTVSRLPTKAESSSTEAMREVLFRGLDKPTGIAAAGDTIWLIEADRLSKSVAGGPLETVVDRLPNNGRSQGTLTVDPPDRLLFDTSGSKRGSTVVEGSGRLWSVSLRGDDVVSEVASGFKHAYAHAIDATGRVWSTEMTDGTFDGTPAPDEVVEVLTGVDHGWPACVGDNRVVDEFGGTDSRCSVTPPSLAILGVGATPTSIVVAPWDTDRLLVALWSRGEIVSLDTTATWPVVPEVLASGLLNPQHLLVDGDSVLVTEFGSGRILRLSAN